MQNPKVSHLLATKRVMRYVKGKLSWGILLPTLKDDSVAKLVGYPDADWCGDKDDKKSTAGY